MTHKIPYEEYRDHVVVDYAVFHQMLGFLQGAGHDIETLARMASGSVNLG